MMDVALYQPEIPQNTAAILRTAVCFGVDVRVIGPASFDASDRGMRRAGLDYAARARVKLHATFEELEVRAHRLVLFTTHAADPLHTFAFEPTDTLLFGRESAGVPDVIHAACAHRVRIPMCPDARSLNLASAVAIGLFHALSATKMIDEKGLR
ncbi:MAG: tRNA (cytidine(34)-2'-O)-methyltransferase [Pseudomonadota bacterium]